MGEEGPVVRKLSLGQYVVLTLLLRPWVVLVELLSSWARYLIVSERRVTLQVSEG